MTKTRTAQQIATDYFRAEYGMQDVAELVAELSAEEIASIVAAVAAQPHLAPMAV